MGYGGHSGYHGGYGYRGYYRGPVWGGAWLGAGYLGYPGYDFGDYGDVDASGDDDSASAGAAAEGYDSGYGSNYDPNYGPAGPPPDYAAGPPPGYAAGPAAGYRPAYPAETAPVTVAPSASAADEDAVTLIFKDGRPAEHIHNYAMTRTTLYVQDPHHREIPMDELDLPATEKANRAAGVSFEVPQGAQ